MEAIRLAPGHVSGGRAVDLSEFVEVASGAQRVDLTHEESARVQRSFEFLEDFRRDKVIYGINTGFGPMAQYRVADAEVKQLQYNIIRSHATGLGKPLPKEYVRGAMYSRYLTFSRGYSGVHPDALNALLLFLNEDLTPWVPEHGSVGASGDLVQMAHVALALIGEGELLGDAGERIATGEALQQLGAEPLAMHIREGLALINGTAMMNSIGLLTLRRADRLLQWAICFSALLNEVAGSYDDFVAPPLYTLRAGSGQQEVGKVLSAILADSQRLPSRQQDFYSGLSTQHFDQKVQPYYSLRCVWQILGPIYSTVRFVLGTLLDELNSVSDNPVVCPDRQTVLHGGNFHGDPVALAMDQLKAVMVKLTVLAERQLNYLLHDRVNEQLPPFVNLGKLGLNYGLQASQFTATSTTAESLTLAFPMYVHSLPSNNDNQDVVSMGTNAALLCARVVENGFDVMSILAMALCQAVDALDIANALSSHTARLYKELREVFPVLREDRALYLDAARVREYLFETDSFGDSLSFEE